MKTVTVTAEVEMEMEVENDREYDEMLAEDTLSGFFNNYPSYLNSDHITSKPEINNLKVTT